MTADAKFVFRLYSVDRSDETRLLMERLGRVVAEHCQGEVQTEIVDVLHHPERAVEANVFATPMLVKELPEPSQRVIGDLTDPDNILMVLGL